jgi:hypothetical protein
LACAQHGDFEYVAWLSPTQSLGEGVKILDRFVAELRKNIAPFQTGLCGGRTWV